MPDLQVKRGLFLLSFKVMQKNGALSVCNETKMGLQLGRFPCVLSKIKNRASLYWKLKFFNTNVDKSSEGHAIGGDISKGGRNGGLEIRKEFICGWI